MNRWLTVGMSLIVGAGIGLGLAPMGARASGSTLYGNFSERVPDGKMSLAFEFHDPATDEIVATRESEAIVRDGRYLAKFDKPLPNGLYAVVVKGSAIRTIQVATFVELQASTPGSQQTGNINISGTLLASKIGVPTTNVGAQINGISTSGLIGVRGQSNATGVVGASNGTAGTGVSGVATSATGSATGVAGSTSSPDGFAVRGNGGVGTGVRGQTNSTAKNGVEGIAPIESGFGSANGVRGETKSAFGAGVLGVFSAPIGIVPGSGSAGVRGVGLRAAPAILGEGDKFGGIFTVSNPDTTSTAGSFALSGTAGTAVKVRGGIIGVDVETSSGTNESINARHIGASGSTIGGRFSVDSPTGTGVVGVAFATTGSNKGIQGQSNSSSGVGVSGIAAGLAGNTLGGSFLASSPSGTGVLGNANAINGTGSGVQGTSRSPVGIGVFGINTATTGNSVGGFFQTSSASGTALFSAGNFLGNGSKNFVIDHPLDPVNKELYHSCIEGPVPFLYYRGSIKLDSNGEAWAYLPDYFQAINKDPQYQLTAIGSSMPGLFIAQEVQNNRFRISGGRAGGKVNWTVTGERNDPGFELREYRTEKLKTDAAFGTYYFPEAYGKPASRGFHYQPIATSTGQRQ